MQRPVLARAAEGSSGLRPHARPAVVAGKNGGATPFAPSPRPSRCLPLRPRRPTWFAWVGRADAGAQRALPRIEGLRGKGHPRPVQGRNRGAQIAYGARGAHGASPYALLPSTSGGSGALLPSIDQRAQRHAGDAIAVLALQPRPGRFGTTQAVSRTASVQAPQPRARRGPPAPIKPPAPAPQSVQRWAPLSEGGSKGAHAAAHSGAIARRLRTSGLPPVRGRWRGGRPGGGGVRGVPRVRAPARAPALSSLLCARRLRRARRRPRAPAGGSARAAPRRPAPWGVLPDWGSGQVWGMRPAPRRPRLTPAPPTLPHAAAAWGAARRAAPRGGDAPARAARRPLRPFLPAAHRAAPLQSAPRAPDRPLASPAKSKTSPPAPRNERERVATAFPSAPPPRPTTGHVRAGGPLCVRAVVRRGRRLPPPRRLRVRRVRSSPGVLPAQWPQCLSTILFHPRRLHPRPESAFSGRRRWGIPSPGRPRRPGRPAKGAPAR
jgi:hypothetical protein